MIEDMSTVRLDPQKSYWKQTTKRGEKIYVPFLRYNGFVRPTRKTKFRRASDAANHAAQLVDRYNRIPWIVDESES